MKRIFEFFADPFIVALLIAALFCILPMPAHATPIHERPHWYVAYVRTVVLREGNAALAGGELYGVFRSERAAQRFCDAMPTHGVRCDVLPVLPKQEWMRKGAR